MNINISQEPLISIGMPLFNAELTVQAAIESILRQSYRNFELIISDNCSTDSTGVICQKYAELDKRIVYVCQSKNIGSALNFKYVLDRSVGKYFMWAAGDDVRTPDFLFENLKVLEGNPNFIASTSQNCMEGQEGDPASIVKFSLEGRLFERLRCFFDNCWKSHGILYSLVRASVLKDCEVVGQSFIAADWAIDLYLASCGEVSRVKKGLVIFGANGISSRKNPYRAFRTSLIEIFLPFYRLTYYVLKFSEGCTLLERLYLVSLLVKLNVSAVYDQTHSSLYQFYCSRFKSE